MAGVGGKRLIMSGIQPTGGVPHLGNYLGAIRQWKTWQHKAPCVFAIVDLHALTTITAIISRNNQANEKPISLNDHTLEMTACLLGSGVDPKKCVLFRQSDVKMHTELMWVFSCITPMGRLNAMTQYKDKKQSLPNVGIFTYPALQVADILLYKSTDVPVGDDQSQHLELTRDMAALYNRTFGVERFPIPKAWIDRSRGTSKVLSLRDPTTKMSKSAPDALSRILMTDDADTIALKIRKAVTDSDLVHVEGIEKRLGLSNLVGIASELQGTSSAELLSRYEGKNISTFKSAITEILVEYIVPIGNRIKSYKNDLPYVESVLKENAMKANEIAQETMKQVRKDIGIVQTSI